MALTALIAAYHESAEPGALRATLPLAGRTLIERQARLARAAGARRIVVLVERMPAALAAALERLRREGLPVQIARGVAEAAEAIEAEDRLIVLGDGALADAEQLGEMAGLGGAAVLTVADGGHGELYERIDGSARWAGAAAMDGALLKDTAAMLRDWDLQSTLLRRALQAGAAHVAAAGPVIIVDGMADIAEAERRIVEGAQAPRPGWAARALAPVEYGLTALVMGTAVGSTAVGSAAATLSGLGLIAFATRWPWVGLALLLLATPLEGVGLRLARLRMQRDAARAWWRYLIPAFAGGSLLALSYQIAETRGWGMVLLAAMTLAFLVAEGIETRGHAPRGRFLLAERSGMTWLMLPFAAFGLWHGGIAALFAYAAASFFWAQHEAHRRRPKAGLD